MAEGYDKRQLVDEEMSDDHLYYEASILDETSEDSHDLEWHQIQDYDLVNQGRSAKKQKVDPKGAKCDSKECIISVTGKFAMYLCYVCNLFLCGECFVKHDKTHECVRVESETDERRRMAEMFVGRMRSEGLGRGINIDREDARVYGRVNVKHRLDERECYITELSGLEKKGWVAVDMNNACIKLFCYISNTLLRYIRFRSEPWDVSEIKPQQKSTDPDSASGSKTGISVASLVEPDKHCLLAVTLPFIKRIWIIDIYKNPTVMTQTIKMKDRCYRIESCEDKIFTTCCQEDGVVKDWYICILSTGGTQRKVLHIPGLSTPFIPALACNKGLLYLTHLCKEKVLCINVGDGKTISELTIEGLSRLVGISIDRNNGVLYLCRYGHHKVYKLPVDLQRYEPLRLDTDYTQSPDKLCFINNKIFISHLSPLEHVVTVVQLLT